MGGGEAALDTALSCYDRKAKSVTVAVRAREFHAAPKLVKEAEQAEIRTLFGTQVASSRYAGVWQVEFANQESLTADELVVCIGRKASDELLKEVFPNGYKNQVVPDQSVAIVLAGDLIRGRDRYVATALGDGQRAAIAAAKFINC